jgi:dolichyl-phosphate mannosyltransferase polypeptide 3
MAGQRRDSWMKHIYKIIAVLAAITAVWVALLETSTVPRSYAWLVSVIKIFSS